MEHWSITELGALRNVDIDVMNATLEQQWAEQAGTNDQHIGPPFSEYIDGMRQFPTNGITRMLFKIVFIHRCQF